MKRSEQVVTNPLRHYTMGHMESRRKADWLQYNLAIHRKLLEGSWANWLQRNSIINWWRKKKWLVRTTCFWLPMATSRTYSWPTQAQLCCLSEILHKSRWANLVRDLMVRRHQSQPTFCSALCLANKQGQSQILKTKDEMNRRKSTYLLIFLRLVVISYMTQYR